jgi:ComF family protein
MQRHLAECDPDSLIVPVPLHRWRIWARGYNQSALIAANLAKRTGLVAELNLMQRIKATPSLKGMGRREREQTVRGAFHMSDKAKAMVAGRTVILVDDVFTTGATANACAKLLKRSGAARVNIMCWARVVPGKDD